jgi:hypothetical protein
VRLTQETAGGVMKQAKKRHQEIFDGPRGVTLGNLFVLQFSLKVAH